MDEPKSSGPILEALKDDPQLYARKIKKRHPLRHTTIRTLHPGRHRIELQVNGARLASATFDLLPE